MDVSLGTLKSLTVQIVGEVASPGVYTVQPFSTVGTSLLSAGGITISGSLRDVRVLRDDEIVNSIDYYKLFLEGQSNTDFRILNGDVIFVPVRISTVEISGEVSRPGIYELLPGEYIDQLISYAGGLKPTSGLTVELKRIIERGERESDDDAVTVSYLDVKSLNPHEVMDGDNIWIRNIMEVSRQVYISGQVKRPGVYAYTDSLRLLDLLKMAGGIRDEDFLKSVNLGQLDITRRDINSDYSDIITLKLAEVINGNGRNNILLNNHDQVTVYPNQRYFPAKTVTLSGEVLLPGVYPIQKDFETIGSIIARSGGFTPRAFENGIILMREGVRLVIEGMENTVADGDIITIPEMTDVVEVRGSVYNPGLINFSIGRSVSQYIRLAGGITPDANKNDLIVIYANGSVKPKRAYVNPRPEPGCIIQVNSRPLLTPTQQLLSFVEGISTTLTQLITTYILVTQIGGILGGG
jgi:protein involved in polysaccharide export with SLBB domain